MLLSSFLFHSVCIDLFLAVLYISHVYYMRCIMYLPHSMATAKALVQVFNSSGTICFKFNEIWWVSCLIHMTTTSRRAFLILFRKLCFSAFSWTVHLYITLNTRKSGHFALLRWKMHQNSFEKCNLHHMLIFANKNKTIFFWFFLTEYRQIGWIILIKNTCFLGVFQTCLLFSYTGVFDTSSQESHIRSKSIKKHRIFASEKFWSHSHHLRRFWCQLKHIDRFIEHSENRWL